MTFFPGDFVKLRFGVHMWTIAPKVKTFVCRDHCTYVILVSVFIDPTRKRNEATIIFEGSLYTVALGNVTVLINRET